MDQDITQLTERLEVFEERLGVIIEGLFAGLDENHCITVQGELHAREGVHISQDLKIIVTLHDSDRRVLAFDENPFLAQRFLGLAVFRSFFEPTPFPVARIRVYPQIW